jgi:hypothetical protein
VTCSTTDPNPIFSIVRMFDQTISSTRSSRENYLDVLGLCLTTSDDCQTRVVYLSSNCVRISSFFETLRLDVCHSARLPGSAAPTGGGAAALRLELNDQTFTHHASIRHSISFEDARRHRLFPYVDLRRDRARQRLLLRCQAKQDDLRR